MGCLIKTLGKGFVHLDKDHKKGKNDKTKEENKIKIEDEKGDKNNEKEKDIDIIESKNNNDNNSVIKNKDNYFKPEQIKYYINVYLKNHILEEPKEKLNYKK